MAGFTDWREGGRTGDDVEGATESRGPVTWWNPTTWGNSYLFDPTPAYVRPLGQTEEADRLKDEGRYLYKRDLGGSEEALTPIQRHAEWLKSRPGPGESDTIFGYDRDEVLQSAADNEGLDITVFRDAILLDAAEQYFNSQSSPFQYESPIGPPERPPVNFFTDPASGSGSGSGRTGPEYVAPDRRVIEEWVGDKLIILTGAKQPELQEIVDAYLSADRQAFEGKSIDPSAEATEKIRGLAEYKRIHTLRPDAAQEDTWVSSRQNRLTQLGVGAKDAAERGILLAATGASTVDIDVGKFEIGKGRKDITMLNRLAKTADQMGRLL